MALELLDKYHDEIKGPRSSLYRLETNFLIDNEQENHFQIDVLIHGIEKAEESFSVQIKGHIENPIIIDDVLVAYATDYGICVTRNTASAVITLATEAYRNSSKEHPTAIGFKDRFLDIKNRFFNKRKALIRKIRNSLATCLIGTGIDIISDS